MGINKKTLQNKFCLLIQIIPQHCVHCFLTVAPRQVIQSSVPLFPSYRLRDRNMSLCCLADVMVTSIKGNDGMGDNCSKQPEHGQ